MENKKIGVISLGCDKNRVDTEKMLYILSEKHEIVSEIPTAQIVIINTCAFLESSRKEAIEEILSVSGYKEQGLEKLIVTGCLPQRFIGEIMDELTEVDAFLGVSDYDKINNVIDRLYDGEERINSVGVPDKECGLKRVKTTDNYAYLKIADGCDNRCTYCMIPSIRGKYRSVPIEDLITEAKCLGEVDELILVAQDTTKYGLDLKKRESLPSLIRALSALDNISGIRLLYCYPENITDELIRELSGNAKMIRYIDIPFQHASDRILKLMNRKGSKAEYLSLIDRLKREVSGIAIRSTFIAGFPTETQEDFNELVDFIREAKLFNAGFFGYSDEDTPSKRLPDKLSKATINGRVGKLYSVQKKIVKENYKNLIGNIYSVVTDGFDYDCMLYKGRAYFNAPDIDGNVYFFSNEELEKGQRVNVRILKGMGYDLVGEKL